MSVLFACLNGGCSRAQCSLEAPCSAGHCVNGKCLKQPESAAIPSLISLHIRGIYESNTHPLSHHDRP